MNKRAFLSLNILSIVILLIFIFENYSYGSSTKSNLNSPIEYNYEEPEDKWYFVSNTNGAEYYKFDEKENKYLSVGKLDYETLVELDLRSKTKIEDKEICNILFFENIDDTNEEIEDYIIYLEDLTLYTVDGYDTFVYYRDFHLKEKGIHLFSEPSVSSKILKDSIPVGTYIKSYLTLCETGTYHYIGYPSGWIYIKVNGVKGWVYRITEEKDDLTYSYCTNGEKKDKDTKVDLYVNNKSEANKANNISNDILASNNLETENNVIENNTSVELYPVTNNNEKNSNNKLYTKKIVILFSIEAFVIFLVATISIIIVNNKKEKNNNEED